jgi:hypothetical protein
MQNGDSQSLGEPYGRIQVRLAKQRYLLVRTPVALRSALFREAYISGQSLPVLTRWTEVSLKPSQTYSAQCNRSNQVFLLRIEAFCHGVHRPPARRAFRLASHRKHRSNEKKKCTNTDVRVDSQYYNAKSSPFWDWPVFFYFSRTEPAIGKHIAVSDE